MPVLARVAKVNLNTWWIAEATRSIVIARVLKQLASGKLLKIVIPIFLMEIFKNLISSSSFTHLLLFPKKLAYRYRPYLPARAGCDLIFAKTKHQQQEL